MVKSLLPLILAAAALAGAGERPLARWSFEHGTDGWRAAGAPVAWSKRQARDGGWSLRLDVAFPQPSSVMRPVEVAVERVGRIDYHVYVPTAAPAAIKTLLFLKDKDGLWFQRFREAPLRPGGWNRVSVDVGPASPSLRPSGHHALWNTVAARRISQVGVKFFCDDDYAGPLYLDAVSAHAAAPARPPLRVLNLRESALEVGRYRKFELTFDLSRSVAQPFDPDRIRIDATFLDPDGKALSVPAFYYQGFVRRLVNDREELVPVGRGCWKVRFAPMSVGPHRYFLTVEHHAGGPPDRLVTGQRGFVCVPSASRGFIRVSRRDPLYFEFDDGTWFYPIGHNVHSPSDDTPRAVKLQEAIGAGILPDRGTFTYDKLFARMAAHGENFAEVWMCAWWLGLEWVADWRHYHGLADYNLHHAWKLDYLVALAQAHGLYLHLVLDNHGKASTWCDPEWEYNPYNVANGGFLASPQEFFRNPIAREIYKKKLRYLVARWGYTTRLAGLELWSEVDLVGDSWDFHANPAVAAPKVHWHRDVALRKAPALRAARSTASTPGATPSPPTSRPPGSASSPASSSSPASTTSAATPTSSRAAASSPSSSPPLAPSAGTASQASSPSTAAARSAAPPQASAPTSTQASGPPT